MDLHLHDILFGFIIRYINEYHDWNINNKQRKDVIHKKKLKGSQLKEKRGELLHACIPIIELKHTEDL